MGAGAVIAIALDIHTMVTQLPRIKITILAIPPVATKLATTATATAEVVEGAIPLGVALVTGVGPITGVVEDTTDRSFDF